MPTTVEAPRSPVVGAEDLVEHAGAITVTDGQQQSVDLSMPLGGHVSGTVTDTAGKTSWRAMIVDVDPASAYVLGRWRRNDHRQQRPLRRGRPGQLVPTLSKLRDIGQGTNVPVSVLLRPSAASGPRLPSTLPQGQTTARPDHQDEGGGPPSAGRSRTTRASLPGDRPHTMTSMGHDARVGGESCR